MVKKYEYLSEISRQLKKTHSTVQYHLNKLEEHKLIEKNIRSNIKTYKLTKKGINFINQSRKSNLRNSFTNFSLGVREETNKRKPRTHNLKIKFPILQDNKYAKFEKETQINNWIKKYDYLPFDVTVEKTPQNIIAHLHEFTTEYYTNTADFFKHIIKITGLLHAYLIEEKQIKIDVFNPEILNKHTANIREEQNNLTDKKSTFSLNLNRPANTIWPNNFSAKAWLDRSLGNLEIETNDLEYEEKLLMMPESLHELNTDIRQILMHYAQNVTTHVKFMQKIDKLLEKLYKKLD